MEIRQLKLPSLEETDIKTIRDYFVYENRPEWSVKIVKVQI